MAAQGKIGTVDLEEETATNYRPVLLTQGIGQGIQKIPAGCRNTWFP